MTKKTERLTWLTLSTFFSTLLVVSFWAGMSDLGDHSLFDPHLQGSAIAALIILAILSITSILQWRKSGRRSK
ncbi:MAG: hypothetical protein WB780_10795 [Candidatus Acidiferrales bacterium]